jgi:cell division protein YceG involved in septum cleavage
MVIRRALTRFLYVLVTVLVVVGLTGIALLLESKIYVFNRSFTPETDVTPFPVGVNVFAESITEQPEVNEYFVYSLAHNTPDADNWLDLIAGAFASKSWFQNLASPVQRIAVIWPGERYEQVVKHFGDILGWDAEQRSLFANLIQSSDPILLEGKFMPGKYVVHKDVSPQEAADLVYQSFSQQILQRYTLEVQQSVPIEDALIIASLLEREASDFENMREISGIIWNRLFIDMPLQLDATLQYARGSKPYETAWWPVPRPRDKFIDSPFNTYQHAGLPPAPIANPSPEAVLAALNPRQIDCLFYFHADNGDFYCSTDYETHVSKLRTVFGRGQ